MPDVAGVLCHWAYATPRSPSARSWALAESYPVDDDGWRLDGAGGRHPWAGWLDAPGRAVTRWTWEAGVALLGLTPPTPWPKWVSGLDLADAPNWAAALTDGWVLVEGTAAEARRWCGGAGQRNGG